LHGKQSIKDFAYVIPELVTQEIDWPLLLKTADELDLHCSLYYMLELIDYCVPGLVPGYVRQSVNPATRPRARDWGWQIGKLFGFVEPIPAPQREATGSEETSYVY